MSKMQDLERMGYRFRLEGARVLVEHFGTPPEGAAALLKLLDREEVRQALQDRAAGFSVAPDGIIWAYGEDVPMMGQKIKRALDSGELWSVQVVYHKSAGAVEFHFQPAEWQLMDKQG